MRYKHIENYPNYIVYENGDIISLKKNIKLTLINNGNGYWKVNLFNSEGFKQVYVHRIVAETFLDNPNHYKYIDHIDRNKNNNNVDNLRWTTAKDNVNNTAGKPRYSKSKDGQKNNDRSIIQAIINEYKNGINVMTLSRKYNIPRQSVSRYIKPYNKNLKGT